LLIGLAVVTSVAIGCGSASATQAKEPTYSEAYQTCLAKANFVDSEMANCAEEERERQDKALNVVYRQLMAKLEPNRRTLLVAAERASMTFRDAQCDMEASVDAGATMERPDRANCHLRLTYDRVRVVKDMLKGEM
jgi:uncharacterized protein YecT (DUF1311 family)